MGQSTARELFAQEIRKPDEAIDLALAALYVAQEEYADLDCRAYCRRLDEMALQLQKRLPQTPYPLKIIKAISAYLFEAQGFVGNNQDYYDPRNSFLNQVIDRRTGIPITLSLVYLELARRIDFPMAGVSMPGHFLIRPLADDMAIFVDPFYQGEILFEEDCRDRIHTLYGPTASLRPEHLAPIGPRSFLVRLLTNLKVIYLQHQDMRRTLGVIERLLLLTPEAARERRDRGLIYYRQGDLRRALADLDYYLSSSPDAPDSFEVQQVIRQIHRTLQA